MCCSGVVVRKSGLDPRCCGKESYDHKFAICCKGFVNRTGAMLDPACCGKQAYDRKFRQCCAKDEIKFSCNL